MRRQNFMLTHAITADPVYEFATEVHAGLTKPGQKELPSKYLYDEVGSALFEVISVLPEYGLTRADERLLRSEEHTSELQSRQYLVCRLLLEKKKKSTCSTSSKYTCTSRPSVREVTQPTEPRSEN